MSHQRIQLRTGEVLFQQGDAPDFAFLVESGRLAISAGSPMQQIGVVTPGELLGEMAVIDRSPRTATATALEPCQLVPITTEQIAERLLNTDPVVRALLEGQLRRYRSTLATLHGIVPQLSASQPEDSLIGIGKIRLEGELREALAGGQLEVRFQPIYELPTRQIAGYEALVRWNHGRRGMVSPAEFIALAEETSLIVPVGEYVLDASLAALARLDETAHGERFVAINVSARQLVEDALLPRMLERAASFGISPRRLKIEITESRRLDYPRVAAMMKQAQAAGIRVALDDFGTGYSNLQHMHLLPFDTLKIDQAFASAMLDNPRALRIVESIIAMAHALDADVVMEGVETQAQLDRLVALGCRYAQGWLIGRPQTREQLLSGGGATSCA
jgi:EAL domain-containing protein (putative c-di-GMP-specific phosphodiesterase class I)